MAAFSAPLITHSRYRNPRRHLYDRQKASIPSRDDLMGTPMTGSGVDAAITPGRWAAIPAAAIITLMPRERAFLANSSTASGVRWAERAFYSNGTWRSLSNCAAFSMTGRSEVLPMIMLTIGVIFILLLRLIDNEMEWINFTTDYTDSHRLMIYFIDNKIKSSVRICVICGETIQD